MRTTIWEIDVIRYRGGLLLAVVDTKTDAALFYRTTHAECAAADKFIRLITIACQKWGSRPGRLRVDNQALFHDALLRGFALYRDIALFWTAPLSRRNPSKAERALRTHVIRNAMAERR